MSDGEELMTGPWLPDQQTQPTDLQSILRILGITGGGTNYDIVNIGGMAYIFDPATGDLVPTGLGSAGGGGGGGSTWRPGEYELQQESLGLERTQMEIERDLSLVNLRRQGLRDAWERAVSEGNLALQREIEAQNAQLAQQQLALERERLAQQGTLGREQIGADIYGQQMGARSQLGSTMADMAKSAAEYAAHPFEAFSYLNLLNAMPGSTPMAGAAGNQAAYGGYQNDLSTAFRNMFGPTSERLGQAWQSTYETPEAARPWFESNPRFQQSTPEQQSLYRSLAPSQQQFLAGATPEQLKYISGFAGGGSMTLQEPAILTGLRSRQPYALMGEAGPERLNITPVRSFAEGGNINAGWQERLAAWKSRMGTRRRPQSRGENRAMMQEVFPGGFKMHHGPLGEARRGYPRHRARVVAQSAVQKGQGGVGLPPPQAGPVAPPTAVPQTPVPLTPEQQLATSLGQALKNQIGLNWNYSAGMPYAPAPNVYTGRQWSRLQNTPSLYQLMLAGASASGFRPEDYLAEQGLYAHRAPTYTYGGMIA